MTPTVDITGQAAQVGDRVVYTIHRRRSTDLIIGKVVKIDDDWALIDPLPETQMGAGWQRDFKPVSRRSNEFVIFPKD